MIISLVEAKTYLRVDITDEDTMIQTLVDSAEAYITKSTGCVFDGTYPLAKTVSFMLVASWYTNRENAQQLSAGTVSILNGLLSQLAMSNFISPPQVPSNLTVTAETGFVWARWLPNIGPGMAGYNVYRDGVQLNTELVKVGQPTHAYQNWIGTLGEFAQRARNESPLVGSYKDSMVVSGTAYNYQISAVDALGAESPLSAAVKVTAV